MVSVRISKLPFWTTVVYSKINQCLVAVLDAINFVYFAFWLVRHFGFDKHYCWKLKSVLFTSQSVCLPIFRQVHRLAWVSFCLNKIHLTHKLLILFSPSLSSLEEISFLFAKWSRLFFAQFFVRWARKDACQFAHFATNGRKECLEFALLSLVLMVTNCVSCTLMMHLF
jgi:hypothetical protein